MNEYLDPAAFAMIDPRIPQIAAELKRLLTIVQLEQGGSPVQVDGFSLKELSLWSDHAARSAFDALVPISGVCNHSCTFCFEQGVPFARDCSAMSLHEARTRLNHYSAGSGKCLFPSNRPHMEPFANRHAVEILEMARKRDPDHLYWITTNGSLLDEALIRRLAALRPLLLKWSINAVDPELRRSLMRVGERGQAVEQVSALLRKHRIPFIGSIVAWPTNPLEAIADTARFLESQQAYAIRIRLPLYHRYFKEPPGVDVDEHWRLVAEFAYRLRDSLTVPLIIEPPSFWLTPVVPEVDGVVANSPAQAAGIRVGDRIQAINGHPTLTRTECRSLLHQQLVSGQRVRLDVQRNGQVMDFRLEPVLSAAESYPYDPRISYPGDSFGILQTQDFQLAYIHGVIRVIERYQAKNILLFSSPLVMPIFEVLVKTIPEFAEKLERVNLHITSVRDNRLGGNFRLTDSRFVDDYARVIRRKLMQGVKLDLILIPMAFGGPWGIDYAGESYSRLSTEFGVPVELINWLIVYGRES